MKQPFIKGAAKSSTVVFVIFALAVAAAVLVYFDHAPNPNGPKCSAGEIKMLSQREWYCVPARKP